MRKIKLWEKCIALVLSAALLVPVPVVSAAETEKIEQNSHTREADADGFVIEDGSLRKYEGNDTDVVIPDVVTSISNYAFKDCTNLKSITIPKGVSYISYCAFEGCNNLSEINVSEENHWYAGENGCLYNEMKTEIVAWPGAKGDIEIPESVTEISERAFAGASGLNSIKLPNSLNNIGEYAFYNCSNLSSVKLPQNLTMINDGVFSSCSSLESIEIPESVTEIGENAFRGCSSLKNVTIPKNLTRIHVYAFEGCSSLSRVEILGNETNIGATVFWHCTNLSTIEVPVDHLYHISENGCLYNKDQTRIISWPVAKGEVKISEKVTYISDYAFSDRQNLVIYGKRGSYAEAYAKEYNIPFVGEGEPEPGPDPVPNPEPKPEPVPNPEPNPNPAPDPEPDPAPQPAPKKAIASCEIKLSQTSYAYDGKAKTPAVAVKDGTKTLKAGTDYALSYKNNTKVGTAKVILTGKGSYTGTAERTFAIKETQKGTQTISCKKSYDKTYGDKPFKLNAKVTKGNGTLTYRSSNKKVAAVDSKGRVAIKGTGIAEITVKAGATSNYQEKSVKVTVKVKPGKQVVKSLKVQKGKKLKVTWKKDKNADGYEIQYSTDKKFKNKKVTKLTRINNGETVSKTLTKLTKGKKYYVRVRAFKNVKVKGKNQRLYGSWSSAKRSGNIKYL